MSSIRPFERDDIPQVASLLELVFRSGSRTAPPRVAAYFERTLIDHPWVDPEIPSLVHVEDQGQIVGFLGSHVRRLRFDGRNVRVAYAGQLMADPKAHNKAVGAFLLRKYMSGSQDLTMTDTAGSQTIQRIWEGFGGKIVHLNCIGWVRIFRPWRFAGEYLARRRRIEWLKPVVWPLASALDAATVRVPRTSFRLGRPTLNTQELTPVVLLEHLPAVVGSFRLYPAYDLEFLEWLFREMPEVKSRGRVVASLVLDASGRSLGWYVYYLKVAGISQVLQIAAKPGRFDDVLDHLLHHAQTNGAAALQGRLEARLHGPLSQRQCILHFSGHRTLVHSADPEILRAVLSGDALITRMEGEWWMGYGLEPFI